MGLDPSFIELIRSYLANRTQCVNINGVLSYIASVTSGVPQGSVLGPLLFIIFINDLPDYCKYSDCFLFADDSKMISTESPIAKNLQHDIDNFLAWSIENSMTFHPDKCKTMLFGKTDDTYQLTIGNHQISTVSCIKDIGVWVADDLSWRPHIEKKLSSASRSLLMLKKNIPITCPTTTKLQLYKSCVLSVILYASQIWFPDLTSIRKLEALQCRALRWSTRNYTAPYNILLRVTNMLPISLIHQLSDLTLFNKLLNDRIDFDLFHFVSYAPEMTGHQSSDTVMFEIRRNRKRRTGESFFNRVVKLANHFLAHPSLGIDIYDSPATFRRIIKTFLFNITANEYSMQNSCSWFIKCNCSTCTS